MQSDLLTVPPSVSSDPCPHAATEARSGHSSENHVKRPDWSQSIADQARSSRSMTVGLMSGSRQSTDRRALDQLARQVSRAVSATRLDPRMLLVRLDIQVPSKLARLADGEQRVPEVKASPLGRWSLVEVPMPVLATAPWTLEQLPRWLPTWKAKFGLIVIDLGPMHLVPSRVIGRLCDATYLILGPESCASEDWIQYHLAWHARSGTHVVGTLVSCFSRAA